MFGGDWRSDFALGFLAPFVVLGVLMAFGPAPSNVSRAGETDYGSVLLLLAVSAVGLIFRGVWEIGVLGRNLFGGALLAIEERVLWARRLASR
jgi:hypothetical protein